MHDPRMKAWQVIICTVMLTAFVLGAYGVAGYSIATRAPKSYVDKEVKTSHEDAVGNQNLYTMCAAEAITAVGNYGETVKKWAPVTIKKSDDTAKVTIAIKSDIYNGKLACSYSKSNWQSQGIQPVR